MLKNQISAWMPVARDGLGKARSLLRKEGVKLLIIFLVLAWALQKDLTVEVRFFSPDRKTDFTSNKLSLNQSLPKAGSKEKRYRTYIEKFAPLAVKQMKANRIPASIILAQGLLESDGGASKLATEHQNHFGIKCFSRVCQKGHCANFNDDSHKDFFRIYRSARESYTAHSEFLKKERYVHLTELPVNDYIAWAYGLKKAGYATDSKYAEKLIALINRFGLDQFDRSA